MKSKNHENGYTIEYNKRIMNVTQNNVTVKDLESGDIYDENFGRMIIATGLRPIKEVNGTYLGNGLGLEGLKYSFI